MQKALALLGTLFLTACISHAELTESGAEFKTASSASQGSQASSEPLSSTPVTERMASGGVLTIGSDTAPVSMLLFINHDSPYSQQFNDMLLPQLIRTYVSAKKLQIGIVPVILQKYPHSLDSSALFLCAAKQKKGQAMNALLFSHVNEKTLPAKIAEMGLDAVALGNCMQPANVQPLLDAEAKIAFLFGVTSVPTYTLNQRVYKGLPEWEDVKGQIEEAMSR